MGLILQSHPSPPGRGVTARGCSISSCHLHHLSPGVLPLPVDMSLATAERITQTVEITKHVVDIEEKGVKLRLTIVDTPGFGDAVNNTEWCVPWRGWRVPPRGRAAPPWVPVALRVGCPWLLGLRC